MLDAMRLLEIVHVVRASQSVDLGIHDFRGATLFTTSKSTSGFILLVGGCRWNRGVSGANKPLHECLEMPCLNELSSAAALIFSFGAAMLVMF